MSDTDKKKVFCVDSFVFSWNSLGRGSRCSDQERSRLKVSRHLCSTLHCMVAIDVYEVKLYWVAASFGSAPSSLPLWSQHHSRRRLFSNRTILNIKRHFSRRNDDTLNQHSTFPDIQCFCCVGDKAKKTERLVKIWRTAHFVDVVWTPEFFAPSTSCARSSVFDSVLPLQKVRADLPAVTSECCYRASVATSGNNWSSSLFMFCVFAASLDA